MSGIRTTAKQTRSLTGTAAFRLARYESERRRRRLITAIGYCLVLLVGGVTILYFSGSYTASIVRWVGLRPFINDKAGVYADCSLKRNQGKGFCVAKVTEQERRWTAISRKNSRPFGID